MINVQDLESENAFNIRFVDEQDVDFTINNAESTDSSITIVIRFVDDKDVPQILNYAEDNEFENDDSMDGQRLNCTETTLISSCYCRL